MKITALTSSLPGELPEAIIQLVELDFEDVDVPPAGAENPSLGLIQKHQLHVSCVALERGLPRGMDLASADKAVRTETIAYFRQAIESTCRLGAARCECEPPVARLQRQPRMDHRRWKARHYPRAEQK